MQALRDDAGTEHDVRLIAPAGAAAVIGTLAGVEATLDAAAPELARRDDQRVLEQRAAGRIRDPAEREVDAGDEPREPRIQPRRALDLLIVGVEAADRDADGGRAELQEPDRERDVGGRRDPVRGRR